MKLPLVAIVGRPNVGKSTLFNRILEEPKALVSEIPGTTRDIQMAKASWRGQIFTLADTGGLELKPKTEIERQIKKQADKILSKANLVVLVIDIKEGVLPQDKIFAENIKKQNRKIVLVANKADSPKSHAEVSQKDVLSLGFGLALPVSAITGSGVGDLLDKIVDVAGKDEKEHIENPIKFTIVGRPNVGKSSLLNAILNEERFITSAEAHTTREPVDTLIYYSPDGKIKIPILLIDTAGIRKRSRVEPGIERAGVKRSLEIIKKADVVFLILDLTQSVTSQDKNLVRIIIENRKGLVIVGNKLDLVKIKNENKKLKTSEDEFYRNKILREVPFLDWVPIIFTSALERKNVFKLLEQGVKIAEKMMIEFSEKELLEFWEKIRNTKIAGAGVRHPRVYSFKQLGTNPPIFTLAVREREPLNPAYLRFLEKKLREWYDLEGVPIAILSKNIKR